MHVQRNHPQRTPHSSTLSTMLIESRIYLLMSSMMCIASWCGRKEMDEIISVSMPFRRIQPLYLVQEPIRGLDLIPCRGTRVLSKIYHVKGRVVDVSQVMTKEKSHS